MINNDWNPELYLKYSNERIQPTIDLISRIKISEPKNIVDIGCGPGNSTKMLIERWPNAKVVGIDNSPAMIKKAKNDFPKQEWKFIDVNELSTETKYDIVFSNAAIQWIPNHEELLNKLKHITTDSGIVAVQLPLSWEVPLGKSILLISQNSRWHDYMTNTSKVFTTHDYLFYYQVLSKLFNSVEIWVTDYVHILNSHQSILEMISSTALKPFMEKLEKDNEKEDFAKEVLNKIVEYYPIQNNGKVLFPFKRLFFIASNSK